MSKGAQIAIAVLSVCAALGWMMASGEGSFQYFSHVSQLSPTDRDRPSGLRVHGYVVEGTIERDVEAGHIDFTIHDRASAGDTPYREVSDQPALLQVRYNGIDVPDLFRDGAEVVIEGGFANGAFVASRIMAKCPSKYEVAPALPEQKA
jgi:cytochrome c-type biogenesis protein CcmE